MGYFDKAAEAGARYERWKRMGILASVVLGVVAVAFLIYLVALVRETQTEGSPLLRAIAEQQDDIERATDAAVAGQRQLADCIDPEGECFKTSQARTTASIASINQISIFAAACADEDGSQTVAEIQQCVIQRLALADRQARR